MRSTGRRSTGSVVGRAYRRRAGTRCVTASGRTPRSLASTRGSCRRGWGTSVSRRPCGTFTSPRTIPARRHPKSCRRRQASWIPTVGSCSCSGRVRWSHCPQAARRGRLFRRGRERAHSEGRISTYIPLHWCHGKSWQPNGNKKARRPKGRAGPGVSGGGAGSRTRVRKCWAVVSTCVVGALVSPEGLAHRRASYRLADPVSRSPRGQRSRLASPLIDGRSRVVGGPRGSRLSICC